MSADATVATYVDKTPLFANFLLSDIERVEILRGPQGTLYGSGALGGAVRFILREPDTEGAFSGRVSLSGSSVKHSDDIGGSASATLNIPLADTLAIRLNTTINDYGHHRLPQSLCARWTGHSRCRRRSGHSIPPRPIEVKEDADTVEQSYGRASLLWRPSDTFDLRAGATWRRRTALADVAEPRSARMASAFPMVISKSARRSLSRQVAT